MDSAIQEKTSEYEKLQNEIETLSDKIAALEETNSKLESEKTGVISEFDKYKTESTEIITLKASKIDDLQLEINSLKEQSAKNHEDHVEEVETLAIKITSLEERLEDNMNKSSSFEKAKEDLESELAAVKAQLQKSDEEHQLTMKQFEEHELKVKKLEENITSLQATEALLITERSKMILELQSYKDEQEKQFARPSTPVKSPQKENSTSENQLSKSMMEELGIAEESNEDIAPANADVVLSDGDEETVDNAISQYEVVSVGVNTENFDLAPSRDPTEVVSIGVNTDEIEDPILNSPIKESESAQMETASCGLFTPPQMESQDAVPVQVEMVSIGVETDPVECVSMSVNTSIVEPEIVNPPPEAPETVTSGVNTSIMTSPEKPSPMNCSFGVNTSFQVEIAKDDAESKQQVAQMQEDIDASKATESQLLAKLEDLNKQLEDSKALASSLEDKNKILLGDNQTNLAAQLDFRSRVEELEVQIDQLKKSHQQNLEELQDEKSRLMKTLEEVETELQNLKTKMAEDKSELVKVNSNIAELQDQLSLTTNQRDAVSLELNELKGNTKQF